MALVDRLQTLMSTATGKVLFIRHEEPHFYGDRGARVGDPAYAARYAQTELHWLKQISQTIKSKYPSLDFKILFLNAAGEFVDAPDNIVGIALPECDYRDRCIGGDMAKNVKAHSDFLAQNL